MRLIVPKYSLNTLILGVSILCIMFITTADVYRISQMRWNWLDSQIIIDQQFWPVDSPIIQEYKRAGRDRIGYGILYQFLAVFVAPVNKYAELWNYSWNYLVHSLNLLITYMVVYRATGKRTIASISTVVSALLSTGPEIYLNTAKNEHFATLFILLQVLFILPSKSYSTYSKHRKIVAGSLLCSCTFLGSGFLGKEPAILFGLSAGLAAASFFAVTKSISREQMFNIRYYLIMVGIGSVLYWIYRSIMGIAPPWRGTYTKELIEIKTIAPYSILRRAGSYAYHASDVLIITCFSILLMGTYWWYLRERLDKNSGLGIAAMACCMFASLYSLMHVIAIKAVQIYYLYPVGFCAVISCSLFLYQLGRISDISKMVLRVGLIGYAVYIVFFGLNQWIVRSVSMVVVTESVAKLMSQISRARPQSVVVLPFDLFDERVGNLRIIMDKVYNRGDLLFISIMDSNVLRPDAEFEECSELLLVTLHKASMGNGVGVREVESWRSQLDLDSVARAARSSLEAGQRSVIDIQHHSRTINELSLVHIVNSLFGGSVRSNELVNINWTIEKLVRTSATCPNN